MTERAVLLPAAAAGLPVQLRLTAARNATVSPASAAGPFNLTASTTADELTEFNFTVTAQDGQSSSGLIQLRFRIAASIADPDPPPSSSSGLSSSELAAAIAVPVVVGSLILLALIALFIQRRRQQRNKQVVSGQSNATAGAASAAADAAGTELTTVQATAMTGVAPDAIEKEKEDAHFSYA